MTLYGLIAKMIAVDGKRDAFADSLLEELKDMPGCLGYVVARDSMDSNGIRVSEVWGRKSSHENSLTLASVRDAITRGTPLIAGFGERV